MERFQKNVENSDEIEIDLSRLFQEIKKKAKFIIFMAIIGAIIAFLFTTFFITKKI